LYPDFIKNTVGSAQDRSGLLRILHVKPGQYTVAKGAVTVAVQEPRPVTFAATVFPNPAAGQIRVKAAEAFEKLTIFATNGEILRDAAFAPTNRTVLSIADLPAGSYWIVLFGKNKSAAVLFQKI
jgi:hypothetical protein